MEYRVNVTFEPLHELMMSLHTYICSKAHKKIDLTASWAKEARQRLSPRFAAMLDEAEIDNDWKLTCLLVYLCPAKQQIEGFLGWLESMTPGDLYERIAPFSSQFPDNMGDFRSRTLTFFSQWNDQYFQQIDPRILEGLRLEERERNQMLDADETESFIDRTTNGILFTPINGLEELILIPQYHFQPLNFICYYGKMTICHYSARIYFNDDDFLSPHEYRMIRCLGEKSRLKILKFLHQGPRSFIEIARHLGLSKGITHDHIAKLRHAGMIYSHIEGEALAEYSLRPQAVRQIQNSLIEYIEHG